jgi:molecular chaperone DnaJ
MGSGATRERAEVELNIPAGMTEDAELVVREAGHRGQDGGPRGDIYIRCLVQEHETFSRNGIDLLTELSISYVQACMGDKIPLLMPNGSSEEIKIPSSWNGSEIVIDGKGFPVLRTTNRGNLRVKIRVKTPLTLTDEYISLLNKMAQLENSYDAQDNQFEETQEGGNTEPTNRETQA